MEVREEQRVRDEPTIDALRKRYVDWMQGANADARLSQLERSEAAGLAEAAAAKRAERAGGHVEGMATLLASELVRAYSHSRARETCLPRRRAPGGAPPTTARQRSRSSREEG